MDNGERRRGKLLWGIGLIVSGFVLCMVFGLFVMFEGVIECGILRMFCLRKE